MSLPDTMEFKPKFLTPGMKTGSMADIAANMQSRGLKLIKRKETTTNTLNKRNMDEYDATAEQIKAKRLINSCCDIGLRSYECTPFVEPRSGSVEDYHRSSVFYYPISYSSQESRARILFVDMTLRQIVYIGESQEPLSEPILLHGSKVDADLVAKRKVHVWTKGHAHKTSLTHTLFSQEYRDHCVEILKCRELPDFPFLCVHEGPLSKKGGLLYKNRFGRLVNGMLVIYMNEKSIFPKEIVSLIGSVIEKVSKNQVRIIDNTQHKFQFKFLNEQVRDLWLRGINVTSERFTREAELLSIFNKMIKKELRKERRRRHSLGHSIAEDSLLSTTYVDTNNNKQQQQQQQEDEQTTNEAIEYEEPERSRESYRKKPPPSYEVATSPKHHSSSRGRRNNNKSSGRRKKQQPQMSQRTKVTEFFNAASSSDQLHGSSNSDDGVIVEEEEEYGNDDEKHIVDHDNFREIEVQLHSKHTGITSMGVVEVDPNFTLFQFRLQIKSELDHIPRKFQFMRNLQTVTKSLEKKKHFTYVLNEDDTVYIKGFK